MRQRGPAHVALLTGSFGKILQSTIISVFTRAPLSLLSAIREARNSFSLVHDLCFQPGPVLLQQTPVIGTLDKGTSKSNVIRTLAFSRFFIAL